MRVQPGSEDDGGGDDGGDDGSEDGAGMGGDGSSCAPSRSSVHSLCHSTRSGPPVCVPKKMGSQTYLRIESRSILG
jgi:hypothetical protein